jgi:hypothetical protein
VDGKQLPAAEKPYILGYEHYAATAFSTVFP